MPGLAKINLKFFTIIFLSLFLVTVAGIVALNSSYALSNSICGGVRAAGVELGGLAQTEAETAVAAKIKKIYSQPVLILKHDEQSWPVMAQDIDCRVDVKDVVGKAYLAGREGNALERLRERFYIYNNGKDIAFEVLYDQGKLKKIIFEIAKTLNRAACNAAVKIVDGRQEITPEIKGININETELFALASEAISKKKRSVLLPAVITQPDITQKDLVNIRDVLASYTTYFESSAADRTHNVVLAAGYLDGALVRPGDIYSFNKGIGPRTVEMGYRDAPVYIGEDIVPGVGGGICQVSSTLYNAILLADLQLTERENHYRPVPYAPLGRDATIAGDIIDLKFKNTSSGNIYIRGIVADNKMTIEILGEKATGFPSIKIVTDNVRVIKYKTIVRKSAKMNPDEVRVERTGANGYRVTTYRLKYQDNKLIAREKLYDDYYPVVDEIVQVGANRADGDLIATMPNL
ncbi:MAG: VanW family protein [Acidaminococcales bacterium]|nr:VanW family protein [Acidaminococcales bacterium]